MFPVVIVKNGKAIQSYGYERYRPLGSPVVLVENYDQWFVDEILLNCIDATQLDGQPDFELVERMAELKISTPLTYGGGIKTVDHGIDLVNKGCDRLLIESGFWDNPDFCGKLADILGRQALMLSLPLVWRNDCYLRYDYRDGSAFEMTDQDIALIDETFSEVVLVDKDREGHPDAFNIDHEAIDFSIAGKILFGGISTPKQIEAFSRNQSINGCAIGNFAAHKELYFRRSAAWINSDRI